MLPARLGRYTLFDHVGRGGMADIYLASARTGLGASRLVVIKEVLPRLAHSARFAELLIAEAKLAARLGHRNIVKVEDLGREDEVLYIAMEYVEGFDLRELLRRCARDRVALPVAFSLLLVMEALRGLDYAHRYRGDAGERLSIVHRDVSPSNVLISFEGEVKLCDFGIARANEVAEMLPDEAIAGKAGYMSPEQARGEAIDARSDVFAAGIILWELLSGRRLYKAAEGEPLVEVARRAQIPPLPSRGLPDETDLHAIVSRALAPQRDDRYLAATGMLRDLDEYAAAAHLVASPLRFGDWLLEHFGKEIVEARRARERALRALERGPAVLMSPVSAVEATPSQSEVAEAESAIRRISAVTTQPSEKAATRGGEQGSASEGGPRDGDREGAAAERSADGDALAVAPPAVRSEPAKLAPPAPASDVDVDVDLEAESAPRGPEDRLAAAPEATAPGDATPGPGSKVTGIPDAPASLAALTSDVPPSPSSSMRAPRSSARGLVIAVALIAVAILLYLLTR